MQLGKEVWFRRGPSLGPVQASSHISSTSHSSPHSSQIEPGAGAWWLTGLPFSDDRRKVNLTNVCWTNNSGRRFDPQRAAVSADSAEETRLGIAAENWQQPFFRPRSVEWPAPENVKVKGRPYSLKQICNRLACAIPWLNDALVMELGRWRCSAASSRCQSFRVTSHSPGAQRKSEMMRRRTAMAPPTPFHHICDRSKHLGVI